MKKIYLLFFIVLGIGAKGAFAQVIFTEDFNFPTAVVGDSIGGGPGTTTAFGDTVWKKHSGTATGGRAIKYKTPSLSFPNYVGSGIGGSAGFQHTVGSADINGNLLTSINSGDVYTMFMLRIDSSAATEASTDYFFHYCDLAGATSLSNFRLRVFAANGSSPTTYKLGLSKGSNSTLTAPQIALGAKMIYTTTEYNLGETYLAVAKYTFNTTSTKDDNISLFIFPNTSTIPLVEPAANISFADTAFSDLTTIRSINIRQGSTGRSLGEVDGFRVFRSWSDIPSIVTPVKLSSFTAQKLNGSVAINWSTEQEINSKEFILQRSNDGVIWSDISTISAVGNSSTKKSYSSADNNPVSGFNLYRLKQVNLDGTYNFSTIKNVLFSSKYKVTVTPNPAKDFINVYISKEGNTNTIVKVIDFSGKVVRSESSALSTISISTNGISKGVYFVKIIDGGNVTTKKISIQ